MLRRQDSVRSLACKIRRKMKINTENLVSITDANRNFSRIGHLVSERGPIIILKNNSPQYFLINWNDAMRYENNTNEDSEIVARRILKEVKEMVEESMEKRTESDK